MIGFRAPGTPDERRLGPNEYVAVRRARFVQLATASDDWLLLEFLGVLLIGLVIGWALS